MKFSLGISNFLEDFVFWAPKSLQMVIAAMELKLTFSSPVAIAEFSKLLKY